MIQMLTDRGIRQAIDAGYLTFTPSINDDVRFQPATIDLCYHSTEDIKTFSGGVAHSEASLPAQSISILNVTEMIDFGQLSGALHQRFFSISVEARSTARRAGVFASHTHMGSYFFTGPEKTQIELGSYATNLFLHPQERIAQLFLFTRPFHTTIEAQFEDKATYQQLGEEILSFDAGYEVTGKDLERLIKDGHLGNADFTIQDDYLVVRAGKKATIIDLPETVFLSDVKDLPKKERGITGGLTLQPYQHMSIETQASFALSPHIGIRFWDNPLPWLGTRHMQNLEDNMNNSFLMNMTDGWMDPGYKGTFSRQPKWTAERTIHPGDVIGVAQVFYFPNGVERPYGSVGLASQYV